MDTGEKLYYFVDIDVFSRRIVSWDSDTKDNVQFGELQSGCHRLFLSKGQYNKLVRQLEAARG